MKYSYIISEEVDVYYNLALEQILFDYASHDSVILYLWQNQSTIVVGINQDPNAECRLEEFQKSGGVVARRLSGGGAVFHDIGNLNFSIICEEQNSSSASYQKIISAGLAELGLVCEYNGRNDLLINGRKFSGNAFYCNGKIKCQHGTIMVDCDISKMNYYLTPEISKLNRNGVQSVASRVVNLSSLCGSITVSRMKEALITAVNAEPLCSEINRTELDEKKKFFSDKKWIMGEQL